ncbi:uncharacterized protein LOC133891426 [Phragmites australis]|uniref:uncharacterized protein LOC133891426 n=1 Tax=Phragmites australis TaxID=29695 RepID=UPI002D77A6E3|nr:uncharacterized protein LOC133891426 [Phragmites australis]
MAHSALLKRRQAMHKGENKSLANSIAFRERTVYKAHSITTLPLTTKKRKIHRLTDAPIAMALARSLAPLFLFFLLVSTAHAARTVADNVQDACSKTQFPKACAVGLATKPESQTASPRRLAELFVNIVAESGSGMAAFVHGKLNSAKDDALFKCYDSCSDDVEEAVSHLKGLIQEPTDAKFLEVKSWLSSTLGGSSTCEDACKDTPKSTDKDDVVTRSLEFEMLLRITLDLITEASGSMSADIALPPSDASAPSYGAPYGAPSPFGGYGSSADAPAYGVDGPAYGASGPSPVSMPVYGASGPGADVPSPSYGASGAPAPSDGASDAPTPSSGDSASDADATA